VKQCFFYFYDFFTGFIVSVKMKNARKLEVFESENWGIFWSLVGVIFKEFSQSYSNFNTKPTRD